MSKKEQKAWTKAVKAAKKRGLIDKTVAAKVLATAASASERPPSPNGVSLSTEDSHWAAFRTFHGDCFRCQGADPFCPSLGVRRLPTGEVRSDFGYLHGDIGRVIQELRRAEHKKREPATTMPEEVKQELRRRAAEKRAANGGPKRPPRVKGVYPQPGTLKAKAADLYRVGSDPGKAAEQLQGKVGTFRSWWREFAVKLAQGGRPANG